nr:DUF418 domain-containing protein [uncultured Undibacterium sp.]
MSNQRIYGYDIARALAIFGMVIVNFKTVMHTNKSEDVWWMSIFNLLDGRASAIFVILAGVGITLVTNAARLSNDNVRLHQAKVHLLRRAAFLFFIGLSFVFIWPADILHYYGIYIAIAALLISLSTKKLLLVALSICACFPFLYSYLDYNAAWNWESLAYADFWSPIGFVRNLFFNGFHPVFPWSAFLILGMALGRMPLSDSVFRKKVFWFGVSATAVLELLGLVLRTLTIHEGGVSPAVHYYFSTTPIPPLPLYFLSSSSSAIAIIALCVHAGESWKNTAWSRPLIYTGQMALTLYVAHIVVGMGSLEALGRLTNQSLPFAVGSALLFCLVAIIFSFYWLSWFKQGPLEWLIRKIA